MSYASRRTVLTAALAVTATGVGVPLGAAAPAQAATDLYASNTDLYTQLAGREGLDFARRYKRHDRTDTDQSATTYPFTRTAVLALHGGGIEVGTSELALAIAGYHPATLTPRYGAEAPLHDYWMFEGLKSSGNSALHVTSTHCDDHVALSLAAGALNVISVHGCTATQAGAPAARPEAVVIGGLNATLRGHLHDTLDAAGFQTIDASPDGDIAGVDPKNICNRTLLGQGAQLELTTELRASMFTVNTRQGRPGSTTDVFWNFAGAVREAIVRMEGEASQVIL
ncbi:MULTISPECIES: poly-gamma-glutamate hydrolase family protein [unclassified Streptomyces]|uniref:poly-gamma-glutamate hydrolase family protein n=1 Tax=unclassified Streptomyces TaxID=2593676 RepID=UPI00278C68F5|nr:MULTISPECIES: poly-gamma-glutamate hydrolase family protein [unclassified Streptomyces]